GARTRGPADQLERSPGDADGRRRVCHSAPRLLEFRLLVARPNQPGQGGLAGDAIPADPRGRPGVHPTSRSADHRQLPMNEIRRIPLATGVTLNVALAGDAAAPPVILLHGFPESHRTWRGVAPLLQGRFRLVMPDQRGFGGSDRPFEVDAYRADQVVADLFALADSLGIDRFALVGHDWGGAAAWAAAIRGDQRVERLAIINSPHPVIFQKSLIQDAGQRAASQYITTFRTPGFEQSVEAMGYEKFFDKSFAPHVDLALIPEAERRRYIADWSQPGALTAMLNWYRASQLIVPPPGATVPMPEWAVGA